MSLQVAAQLPGPTSAQSQTSRPLVGAYVWGGLLNGKPTIENFHASVRFVLNHGFEAVRFTVSPSSIAGYGTPICSATEQMRCALQALLRSSVFDDPRLKLVVITLHDFSFGQRPLTDAPFLEQHRAAIMREYRAGLGVISDRFANRRVKVVISNWEGDNIVYCGGAYRFATEPEFANKCSGPTGRDIELRMRGFLAWLELRSNLIEEVRRKNPTLEISHAPEFNNVLIFARRCRHRCDQSATLVNQLASLPALSVCSYSAYDGIRENQLPAVVGKLSAICPKIILGEVGIRITDLLSKDDERRAKAITQQVREAQAPGLLAIIIWNAFEAHQSRDRGFGLFEEDGTPRTFLFWRELLALSPIAPRP